MYCVNVCVFVCGGGGAGAGACVHVQKKYTGKWYL